jgi:hypothetical protein
MYKPAPPSRNDRLKFEELRFCPKHERVFCCCTTELELNPTEYAELLINVGWQPEPLTPRNRVCRDMH